MSMQDKVKAEFNRVTDEAHAAYESRKKAYSLLENPIDKAVFACDTWVIPLFYAFIIIGLLIFIGRWSAGSVCVKKSGFASYNDVSRRWALQPCDGSAQPVALTDSDLVNYNNDTRVTEGFRSRRRKQRACFETDQEGFAKDYDTVAKNWGLTPCDVQDQIGDASDMITDADLVNYAAAAKKYDKKEGFAKDYETVSKNWGLTPCNVQDQIGDASDTITDADLVNYAAAAKKYDAKEGFARDYATVSKNWGLTPCNVQDQIGDASDTITDADLVNYAAAAKKYDNKESFATDYATVARNWALSPCEEASATEESTPDANLVNYAEPAKSAFYTGNQNVIKQLSPQY